MNLQKVILLIGSNPNWLDDTIALLDRSEHIILFADNGKEGFRIAQCDHPDLIISELMLPDISGIDLCRLIRDDKELFTVPLILVNENQQAIDEVVKDLQLGVDDYLTVCCNPENPSPKTRWLLGRKHSEAYLELSHQILCRRQYELTKIIKDTSELIIALNIEHRLDAFDENRDQNLKPNIDERIEIGMNIIDGLIRLLKEQSKNLEDLAEALGLEEFNIPYSLIKREDKPIGRDNVHNSTVIFQPI